MSVKYNYVVNKFKVEQHEQLYGCRERVENDQPTQSSIMSMEQDVVSASYHFENCGNQTRLSKEILNSTSQHPC